MTSSTTMTSTRNSPAPAASNGIAILEASAVWSILSHAHKAAIRAFAWAASTGEDQNGSITASGSLLVRFGVKGHELRRVRGDLESLKLIVPTGEGEYTPTYRVTWLPMDDAPAGNDFLTVDVAAWQQAKAERPLKAHEQVIIDTIATANTRPDLLDGDDVRLLTSIESMVRDGGRPSERQVWAVNAIRNRVLRGETRKPAAQAPAPTATPTAPTTTDAETPAPSRKRKASNAKASSAPKAPEPMHSTQVIPKATPFAEGARIIHDRFGAGVVIWSDDEKTVARFNGTRPGMGDDPAVRVLTVALRAI